MKTPLLMILILTLLTPLMSQEWDPLVRGRHSYYNCDPPQIVRAILQEDYQQGLLDGADSLLLEAGTELLLGMLAMREEDEDLAEAHFSQSYEISTQKLSQDESLQAYRLMAASGYSLAAVKGIGALIAMTGELDRYIERILELAPQDPLGLLMKAQRLTFAPRLFGGDPEFAISLLEQNILNWDDLNDHCKYETLATMSFAWEKLRDPDQARSYAESALEIFPGNLEMQQRLEELS